MMHPVGSLPPNVYWRRRVLVICFVVGVVLLLALTSYVACSPDKKTLGGSSSNPSGSSPSGSTPSSPNRSSGPSSGGSSSGGPTTSPAAASSRSAASSSTPPVTPVGCTAAALSVQATTSAASYAVGSSPVLYLQVTNAGTVPCTENLADSNVELRVYNGASRVWGSHDCQVEPGTNVQTLVPGRAIKLEIQWSGLSSQPSCAGERQRVGAGTYTLYALLAGQQGKAATFALTQSG